METGRITNVSASVFNFSGRAVLFLIGLYGMKRSLGAIKQCAVALCQLSIVVVLLPVTSLHADDATRPAVILTPEAAAIHSAGMLFDGHNDLPWEVREKGNSSFDTLDISQLQPTIHTDIPRLRKGGLKAQFWSVYVPAEHDKTGDALLQSLDQISDLADVGGYRAQTIVASIAAAGLDLQLARGKVQLVVEDDDVGQVQLQKADRLTDCPARLVHVGVGLEQQDFFAIHLAFRGQALEFPAPRTEAMAVGYALDGHESDIVPVTGILVARIA